jgi:hypothetical protein
MTTVRSRLTVAFVVAVAGQAWVLAPRAEAVFADSSATAANVWETADTFPLWRHLAVGWDHTCGVDLSGKAWCWGANWNGQLGTGSGSPGEQWQPAAVVATSMTRPLIAIAAGAHHSCALDDAGQAWCGGANWGGRACRMGGRVSGQHERHSGTGQQKLRQFRHGCRLILEIVPPVATANLRKRRVPNIAADPGPSPPPAWGILKAVGPKDRESRRSRLNRG